MDSPDKTGQNSDPTPLSGVCRANQGLTAPGRPGEGASRLWRETGSLPLCTSVLRERAPVSIGGCFMRSFWNDPRPFRPPPSSQQPPTLLSRTASSCSKPPALGSAPRMSSSCPAPFTPNPPVLRVRVHPTSQTALPPMSAQVGRLVTPVIHEQLLFFRLSHCTQVSLCSVGSQRRERSPMTSASMCAWHHGPGRRVQRQSCSPVLCEPTLPSCLPLLPPFLLSSVPLATCSWKCW